MNPAILPSISKVKKYLIFSVDGKLIYLSWI